MSRETREIKIVDSSNNLIATGKAIPVEPLSCAFCGNHICPGTRKIYYSVPLSSTILNVMTELCSVRCIQEFYTTEERKASSIKVIQEV